MSRILYILSLIILLTQSVLADSDNNADTIGRHDSISIYDKMLIKAFQSVRYHDSINDNKATIHDLFTIGRMFAFSNHIGESMEYLQRARIRCEVCDDSTFLAEIFMLQAENYQKLGIYTAANMLYQRADSLFIKKGDISSHIFAYYCIAFNYQNQYELSREKEYIDTAMFITTDLERCKAELSNNEREIVKDLIVTRIMLSKAETISEQDAESLNIEALSILLHLEKETNNRKLKFYIDNIKFNKALAYINMGHFDKAGKIISTINEQNLTAYQKKLYFPVLIRYYKASEQWVQAYQAIKRQKRLHNTFFNIENTFRLQKYRAQVEYEKSLTELEKIIEDREKLFSKNMEHSKIINKILILNVVILVVIIILLIINTYFVKRTNKKLLESKQVVENQNEQLENLNNTYSKLNNEIKEQYNTILKQIDSLRLSHSRMNKAMYLAQAIQMALMPSRKNINKMLGESFIYWNPVAQVSGDFLWARETPSFSYVVASDCTGHSVPGALLSMLGISILNDISCELDMNSANTTPALIIDKVQDRFVKNLHIYNEHIGDSMDLALVKINTHSNELQYAGANRPLLIVHDSTATEYKSTKMCIGYNIIKLEHFVNNIIQYEKGDVIYISSDGYSDQFGGSDGHTKFGSKRFNNLMAQISTLTMDNQEATLKSTMQDWMSNNDNNEIVNQLDDQLIIGIRLN